MTARRTARVNRSSLRVVSLECGVDVVAERERDLGGTLDDARGARYWRDRLEGGDDLVARRPGCESVRYGVLEGRGRCVDGDRRGDAYERRGLLVDERRWG